MSATVDEQLALEVIFDNVVGGQDLGHDAATEKNHQEVLEANRQASTVDSESLAAFLELLAAADAEYLDAADYAQPAAPEQSALAGLDWDALNQALAESQQILIGMQRLLSETLAAAGVADHEHIRVYADEQGWLRLVGEHPRSEEIETILNSPENLELRNLHAAAMAGMSLAGTLVGSMTTLPSAAA